MTNQQDNIAALLQDMKSSVSEFEQTEDTAILQRIDADFQRFAQLVTLFLIAERDTYYGYFLMSMAFRTNYAVSTIAGIRLGEYPPVFETNPLILLKYSLKEILYIFCHEIDHVVFNHPAEMMRSNPEGNPELFELFNYAADASVNDMLNAEIKHGKKFMQAPKGVVTSKVIRDKFRLSHVQPLESYQYYFDLIKHHANMLGEPQQDGIAPIPSGSAENNAIPGGVATSNVITAADAAGNINDHAWTFAAENDEPASESAEAMAEAVKELLNEVDSMMDGEARGLMPARFSTAVARANKPPALNWKAILKKYMGTIAADKVKTRMRLNRRQPQRFDLSGTRESKTLKIVVAIDTSGSVSDKEIEQIFSEIFAIIARRSFELTVIECDEEIQRVYQLKSPKDLPNRVEGRGGTSFTPVIEYINEHRYFRDALLIYFTDGYGEASIPRPLTYRNLWVVLGNTSNLSVENPYGLALPLEE
ncbi:VWA-like domain-containing protein [Senegalimassilia anaerobia]|uniref:vWA domain-containing protein n=1 Tax=Senegalimassilia anaerobia TaxID=1473216 RepID=UPI003A97D303